MPAHGEEPTLKQRLPGCIPWRCALRRCGLPPGPLPTPRPATRPRRQGMDPSHGPFLHHGLTGMNMAESEPMDAEALPASSITAEQGFVWRHGAYSKRCAGRVHPGAMEGGAAAGSGSGMAGGWARRGRGSGSRDTGGCRLAHVGRPSHDLAVHALPRVPPQVPWDEGGARLPPTQHVQVRIQGWGARQSAAQVSCCPVPVPTQRGTARARRWPRATSRARPSVASQRLLTAPSCPCPPISPTPLPPCPLPHPHAPPFPPALTTTRVPLA